MPTIRPLHHDSPTNDSPTNDSPANRPSVRRQRAGRHLLATRAAAVAGAAACSLGALSLLAAPGASASPATTPNTPQLVAMYDSPAVQLVTSREQVTVTWHEAEVSLNRLVAFANQDRTTRAASTRGNYRNASEDIVTQFLDRAASYLAPGAGTSLPVSGTTTGSAWGVSSNGYLVTNHHVVQPIDDATWIGWATAADPQSDTPAAAGTVAQSLERQLSNISWGNRGLTLTGADRQAIEQLAAAWVTTTSTVSNHTQTIDVGGGQNVNVSDAGMPAQIISTSPGTWPHADVAILKIDATDLPVVPLGDDTTLQTGDPVDALGYPAAASFQSGASQTATVTATLSSGEVTNRLQSVDGFSLIEDSATINHGNSGGPLVNASGQVVGMVTAVDTSTDTATETNGGKFFYAIPVSVVRKYLAADGITQLIAPDQAVYDHAMSLMQQSHYKAALTDLNKVETDGYATPYIMMHTQMVQAAIHDGQNKPLPESDLPKILEAILGAAGAMGAAGALYLLIRRRRAGTRPAGSSQAEAQGWAGPTPDGTQGWAITPPAPPAADRTTPVPAYAAPTTD